MSRFGISLAATNIKEYKALAKKMRQTGRTDLRKKLRQNIADAGKPVLADLRERVKTLQITSTDVAHSAGKMVFHHNEIPSRGGGGRQRAEFKASKARSEKSRDRILRKGRGLRASVAAATKLQITAKGVRFYVDSKQLPEDQRTLPRRLDSAKGWRHPVFGDREKWVHQKGGPWFVEPLKKQAPVFRKAVVKAMDEIRTELEK